VHWNRTSKTGSVARRKQIAANAVVCLSDAQVVNDRLLVAMRQRGGLYQGFRLAMPPKPSVLIGLIAAGVSASTSAAAKAGTRSCFCSTPKGVP